MLDQIVAAQEARGQGDLAALFRSASHVDGRLSTEADGAGVLRSALTIPNAVTLVRLCLIPVYLWLVFGPGRYVAAGHPARRRSGPPTGSTASWLGASARSRRWARSWTRVADRILVLAAVISVAWVGAVPLLVRGRDASPRGPGLWGHARPRLDGGRSGSTCSSSARWAPSP